MFLRFNFFITSAWSRKCYRTLNPLVLQFKFFFCFLFIIRRSSYFLFLPLIFLNLASSGVSYENKYVYHSLRPGIFESRSYFRRDNCEKRRDNSKYPLALNISTENLSSSSPRLEVREKKGVAGENRTISVFPQRLVTSENRLTIVLGGSNPGY